MPFQVHDFEALLSRKRGDAYAATASPSRSFKTFMRSLAQGRGTQVSRVVFLLLLARSVSLSLSLYLSLAGSISRSLALLLSRSLTLSRSLALSRALSLSLSRSLSLAVSLSLSLSR